MVKLTGLHFERGPKNLSRVYRYLTLSLASLAASVILASSSLQRLMDFDLPAFSTPTTALQR